MSWEQLKYVNSSLKCSCGGFTWESHPVSLLCPELTQEGEKVAFPKECGSFWVVLALKILFYRYNCMKKNFSFVRLACLSLCLLPLMFCFYLTTWWLRICTVAVHMHNVSCCCRTRMLDPWKLKELKCFQIGLFMLIKYLGAGPAGRHLGIIRASDTPREPEPWWAL